jgi:monovalent cation:H+ antiporter-2, CPA2 family
MHEYGLLLTLAIGFSMALALGFLAHRLGFSPLLGYLVAGVVVGPFTPGPTADVSIAEQLSEVGVILLMFGVGLHFHLKDLWAVRRIAVPGAIIQSAVATAVGTAVVAFLGWSFGAGLVFGLSVSVASTVVLMRILEDNGVLDSERGRIAVGWLVVEDILTVVVLVLLPSFAAGGQAASLPSVLESIGLAVLKIGVFAFLALVPGGRFVPWFLTRIARTRSRELFTLSILAFALAVACISAIVFGASIALGAFIAGMVVGQTKMSEQAGADALPMKDAFAVLFFVSVGMLFNPQSIIADPWPFLAAMGIILLVKPLVSFLIVTVAGYSSDTALTVATGLAQIGEFSFIVSAVAVKLKLFTPAGESALVAAAVVSIALNPFAFRLFENLGGMIRGKKKLWGLLNRRAEARSRHSASVAGERLAGTESAVRAVVIGYGPVGKTVTRILAEFGVLPVVVDLNVDTVTGIAASGGVAVYGDAAKPEVLRAAGIEKARYLIVTMPEMAAKPSLVLEARKLNPEVKILVRVRYLSERPVFEELAVAGVCYEEAEVALRLSKLLLLDKGVDAVLIRQKLSILRGELFDRESPIATKE